MSKTSGKKTAASSSTLPEDVPWRESSTSVKPIPKIHQSPLLRLPQNPTSNYALYVMKLPNPIGGGFGTEALLESAGPECVVPGQITPIKLLGLKVWPIYVNLKFIEPVGKNLKNIGKFMDSAVKLMDASIPDR